ncbi:MAG: hypothetical protein OWR62_10660 [Sulfobacillus thermotolerans]|nr:hypothetical protein [Sulfobacillus thermotolerans]
MIQLARRFFSAALGLGLLTLAGCGETSVPPQPAWPTVTVSLNVPSRTLRLPLTIAQNLNLYRDQHIQVRWTHSSSAMIHVDWVPGRWPMAGSIASAPDIFLAAPQADPHFRLRQLSHLPVDYASTLTTNLALINAVMTLNQTRPDLHPLPWPEIEHLWAQRHLPWVLVTLAQLQTLTKINPHTVTLNWLGASTGPIPDVTISGRSAHLSQFLAALNIALWYIHTTPAPTLVKVLRPSNPALWNTLIKQGVQHHLWPATTRISAQEYNRGRALYGLEGSIPWPPYYSGVDIAASDQAFKATY